MMTDMFLQIDNSKAGKYAFALTGRGLPRYTRLPRASSRWAFIPFTARTTCVAGTKTFNSKEE